MVNGWKIVGLILTLCIIVMLGLLVFNKWDSNQLKEKARIRGHSQAIQSQVYIQNQKS